MTSLIDLHSTPSWDSYKSICNMNYIYFLDLWDNRMHLPLKCVWIILFSNFGHLKKLYNVSWTVSFRRKFDTILRVLYLPSVITLPKFASLVRRYFNVNFFLVLNSSLYSAYVNYAYHCKIAAFTNVKIKILYAQMLKISFTNHLS